MRLAPLPAALRVLFFCGVLCISGHPGTAHAQSDPAIQQLLRRLDEQDRLIRAMERRINELESAGRPAASSGEPAVIPDPSLEQLRGRGAEAPSAPARTVLTAQAQASPQPQQTQQTAPASGQPAAPASGQQAAPASGQQAPAGDAQKQGATDIRQLAQQPSIFERKLTVELGTSYARFDRRQLALSGFYALDSIFLGKLSLDQIKGSTFTHDLTLRYGLLQNLSADIQVPWVMRSNRYISGGANYDYKKLAEARVDTSAIGDLSMGVSWQIFREVRGWADVVGSLRLKVPTGEHPFGIPNRTVREESKDNGTSPLVVPERLPTGSGLRSVLASVSVLKSFDPVVLYGNVGLTVNLAGHFDDLSGGNPGSVVLGNTLSLGGGAVLALNDTTAFSAGVSILSSKATRTRAEGGEWAPVSGSSGNAAVLSLGVTQSIGQNLSLVTSFGVGLTNDAPNYTLSVRIPYRF